MKKIYLLFTFVLLLTACEKTDDLILENPSQGLEKQTAKKSSNLKSIKAGEIPEIVTILEELMESSNKSSNKNSFGFPPVSLGRDFIEIPVLSFSISMWRKMES